MMVTTMLCNTVHVKCMCRLSYRQNKTSVPVQKSKQNITIYTYKMSILKNKHILQWCCYALVQITNAATIVKCGASNQIKNLCEKFFRNKYMGTL